MNALVTLVVLAIIFCLLGQIPLVVGGEYGGGTASAWVKVAVLKIPLYPTTKKQKKPKDKKPSTEKKPKEKMTVMQILSLAMDLLPVLRRAVGRFYQTLRMDEFRLHIVLPGEDDPAGSTIRYGQLNGILGALWTSLVDILHIQEGSAGVQVDFTAQEMELDVRGVLSIKLGQLVTIALTFAAHGICIFLRHRRKNKLRKAVS